ncbi:DUF3131 domain-containing protein [Archangium sp.]|jgi:hypothetical protein|uniref:DUF3131 domain-containing protein n=1 Tax=Archangium sp. TaxID=1872627 RepID=UPI002ED8893A
MKALYRAAGLALLGWALTVAAQTNPPAAAPPAPPVARPGPAQSADPNKPTPAEAPTPKPGAAPAGSDKSQPAPVRPSPEPPAPPQKGPSTSGPAAPAPAPAPIAVPVQACPPVPARQPTPLNPLPGGKPAGCFSPEPQQRCLATRPLCDNDWQVARIAWKYFEKNYQPKTGLVNSVDGYPSTTMWDIGSSLAGTIAAVHLGLIEPKEFDDRVVALLATLRTLRLYRDELPNKAYNAATAELTDYTNKPVAEGLGYSALDLARLASWLDMLSCMHPKHAHAARQVLLRWKFCRLIQDGQLYGAVFDPATKKDQALQEGRLGYEQYGGKAFALLGFDQSVSARYDNQYASMVEINGVPIAFDMRDPRKFGAFNYVVTESYALDALEFGRDAELTRLLRNIYEVQKRRWQRTGIVTAVSEDNVDRPPYFVYNTIFAAGSAWNTITDTGADQHQLKSLSTKAAFSLAALFPEDPYSSVLVNSVWSAYDAERGWYSGVYESGIGYNKAITANTNGIILETLLYKALGPLHPTCQKCGRALKLGGEDVEETVAATQCLPGAPRESAPAGK